MPVRFLGTAYKEEDGRALRRGPRVFPHPELWSATNGFNRARNLIGEGGFGPVFRGQLGDGQVVAVKKLDPNGIQGIQEFRTEIMMLGHLKHQNVIKLIGYCADDVHRIVVYEYMPLGSLDKHLFDRTANQPPLDWNSRMKIATGTAKGLEYLHNRRRPQIIYRDVKSSNILLDEDFTPKLSDFGLARLGPVGDATHVTTRVMGTYGYCAPDYAMTGHLTTKSDVYSFGVVLLEILTGRRAIDNTRSRNEENLVAWARPRIRNAANFPTMVDPLLRGRFPYRCFMQAMAVAAMCIMEQASLRPEMKEVVIALLMLVPGNRAPEQEIRLAPPPPPVQEARDPPVQEGGDPPVQRSSRSAPLPQATRIESPVRRASHEGGSSSTAPRPPGIRIGSPVRRGGDGSPSTHRNSPDSKNKEIVEEGVGMGVGSSSQPGGSESQPARSSSPPEGSESLPAGSRSPLDEPGGSESRRPGKEPETATGSNLDRERVLAESIEWAENLRDERRAGKEIVDDTSE